MKLTLKRIWSLLRPYPGPIITVLLLGFVIAGCASLLPKLVDIFFKRVLENREQEFAWWIPFAFPALYAVMGTARYFHFTGVRYLSEVVVTDLRKRMLEKLTRLNLGFHSSFGSGSGGLMSRFLNDTAVLQEGIYFSFDLVREPFVAIGLLFTMLYLDWKLTLFALMVLPVIIVVLRQVSRSLKKYGYLNREAVDGLTGTVKESLDGIRIIQSFNLESEISRRFSENLDHYLRTRKKIINREEGVSPLNEFVVSLVFMGFAFYAIKEVFAERTSPGELIAFLTAAGLLQMPIKRIQSAIVRLQQTIVVTERLYQLLESSAVVPQPTQPKKFPKEWRSIRFENVSFAYGEELVLQNINLTIRRGDVIALVGESGSGKSTVVNLLERFFEPSQGKIYIDDVDIAELDLEDLRKHIALVTQDVFLFRDTVTRNIHAGDFSKDPATVVPAAKLANAHSFISRMPQEYESQVGDRGGFLSGGEKQRLSIARAILKDAPILILDEATSALDSVSELEVQKGLQSLLEGRTAFVIAHRLSTVFNATRILVLKKGRIVEDGQHAELLQRQGEYFNFYQMQTRT